MRVSAALRAGCALLAVGVSACGGHEKADPFEVRIVSQPVVYTNGREVRFQVQVTGAYEGVDLVRDGAIVAELAPPETYVWRTADVADGTYRFVARARRGTEQVLSAPVNVVVDRAKPVAIRSSPSGGSIVYAPYPTIEITYDEPMDPASLAGAAISVKAGGTAPSLTVDVTGATLRIEPSTWADPMEVSVTGLRDLAGNACETITVSYPVVGGAIAGPRELGDGIRFSNVRVAAAPDAGAVVAALAGDSVHVYKVDGSGVATALEPLFSGQAEPGLATDAAGTPTLAYASWGGVSVYRWDGSAWAVLGGGIVPGTSGTNNGWASVVLDDSGNPVVSWTSLVWIDATTYRWTANVARLSGGSWMVLPGFHPDDRQSHAISPVALVDGVPYLACWESPKPGATGSSGVVLRRWTGAAWETALETGVDGLPDLGAAGGRAALSVADLPTSGTGVMRVFTHEPSAAWAEVGALAHAVDAVLTNSRWEVPAAVAPGPADAAVLRTEAGELRMDFRLPSADWQIWGTPGLDGARQVWPAIALGADGLYRVAHVERGAGVDWLAVSTLRLAP